MCRLVAGFFPGISEARLKCHEQVRVGNTSYAEAMRTAELGMKLPAAGRLFVAACTGKKTRGSLGNCPTCSAECRRCPRAAGGHGITYIVWSGDLFLPRLSLVS